MSDNSASDAAKGAADKLQGETTDKGMFDKDGAIGKQFQPDGNIGSVGEAIGGPLASDGVIGKQFTAEGAVGGTVQQNLGDNK